MNKRYDEAIQQYTKYGIDVEGALNKLKNIKISIHCWQGDDVGGFEIGKDSLDGGIAATGNYMGKARTPEELRSDLDKALSLIPGKHKINLHAIYADSNSEGVDRDALKPEHFKGWVDWAKTNGLGLDFNPTMFSHPKSSEGLTLSHPDPSIRQFWINHAIACREIAAYFGKETGQTCLTNLWIPDGYKDIPSDRLGPRARLKESLDKIYEKVIDPVYAIDSVESKVFGIGAESYTVGSHEFYMSYAQSKGLMCLLDNGHYHPTEMVSDKLSSMLLFNEKVALHVTRPVRWDSDHIVIFDDELKEMAKEIVRNDAIDRVLIGLDFFDASVNRVAAWVLGTRNMQKALLFAMLQPNESLKTMQESGRYTERLVLMEEMKTMPFGDVWNYFCQQQGVPMGYDWMEEVLQYESNVLIAR